MALQARDKLNVSFYSRLITKYEESRRKFFALLQTKVSAMHGAYFAKILQIPGKTFINGKSCEKKCLDINYIMVGHICFKRR